MATGGRDIDPSLFKDKLTDDVEKMIKNIAIIQYSQVTGKCPQGHKYCLNAKCWLLGDDDEQ
jgi:hypothetical protein